MVSEEPGFGKPLMLWMFEKGKAKAERVLSLVEKVMPAIAHYEVKHGVRPNIILIHKSYANEIGIPDGSTLTCSAIAGVPIFITPTLQTGHIMVGYVDDLNILQEEDNDDHQSSEN